MLLRCCMAMLLLGCELKSGDDCNCDAGQSDAGPRDAGVMDSDVRPDGGPDAGPPRIVSIAAGDRHSCAVRGDGALFCWGDNAWGQRGNPDIGVVPVQGVPAVVEVCAGTEYSCARTQSGQAWCWGDNTYSQLGTAGVSGPNLITFDRPAERIFCGGRHACIIDADHRFWCWGANNMGEIAENGMSTVAPPWQTSISVPVVDAALGSAHTCILAEADGTVRCWGYNPLGQVTEPGGAIVYSPVTRVGSENTTEVAAGGAHSCRIGIGSGAPGAIDCWPSTSLAATARPMLPPYSGIEAGAEHVCAIDMDGIVVCWGSNLGGQLGSSAPPDSGLTQYEVDLQAPATLVTAGGEHTCALTIDDEIYCWGTDDYGAVSGTPTAGASSPTLVQLP